MSASRCWEMSSWEMSGLGNVLVGKCPSWEMSGLGNVRLGNVRLGSVLVGKCLVGKCPLGYVRWEMSYHR